MPRLRRLTAKQIVKILENAGFCIHHIKGSHIHLRHSIKLNLRAVIPFHGKILAPKTIKSIMAQTELEKDFLKDFFE